MKKILTISLLIIACSYEIRAQNTTITKYDYSTEFSGIVVVNDNVESGVRTLSPYVINRPVSKMRYVIVNQREHTLYNDAKQKYAVRYKQNKKTIEEIPLEVTLLFGGYYVLEIANTAIVKPDEKKQAYTNWRQDKYLGTTEGYEPFRKISESEYLKIKTDLVSNLYSFGQLSKPEGSQLKNYASKIKISLADVKRAITEKVEASSGAYNVIEVGFAVRDEEVRPIVLVLYGKKQTLYAMYGMFRDISIAREYGYTNKEPANRVYFSERKRVDLSNVKLPANLNYLLTGTPYKLGIKVFSYDEVVRNANNCQNELAWRTQIIHSQLPVAYDNEGNQTKQYDGEHPPTPPDDIDNTNPVGCQECPDQDYYWKLFVDCINKQNANNDKPEDPAKFLDYRDYMAMDMNTASYDPSVYDEQGALTPKFASQDNMPVEPYVFDKNGNLLSREPPMVFDPWHPAVNFNLYWLGLGIGWKRGKTDITSATRQAMILLRDYYDNTIKSDPKKLLTNTDFLVQINTGYEDVDWHLGSPMERYQPYKNGKDFVVFDLNYFDNGGQPFKITTPLVKKYASGLENGRRVSFPEDPADNYRDDKDAYIRWRWPIIYRDKYSTPYQIGTVEYRYKVVNNSDNLMYTGLKHDGNTYNKSVLISGPDDAMLKDPVSYDLNSKEYRTDQTDPNDRDNRAAKAEALAQIAKKILVAELLQLALRSAYVMGEKNNAAAIVYEVGAKYEHNRTLKITKDIAKECLKTYHLWQQSMDAMAKVRDTYRSISTAWDGLLTTTQYIRDYYKTLDWKKIDLTNITAVFPESNLFALDWAIYNFQYALSDYSAACHGLALLADNTVKNDYGNLNQFLNQTYLVVGKTIYEATSGSSTVRNNLRTRLENLEESSESNVSEQANLSNFTQAIHTALTNQRMRVANQRTKALATSLSITQREARDWIQWQEVMHEGYSTLANIDELPEDPQTRAIALSNILSQKDSKLFKGASPDMLLENLNKVYGQ